MGRSLRVLIFVAAAFLFCKPAISAEFEISDPEEAYLRLRERIVYVEAKAIPSHMACAANVKGNVSRGTGYLLNEQYVITAFHVLDVKLGIDEKHCFVVYRESDRSAPIVGAPRYVPGSAEPRLRLGDQDVAIFQLVRPIGGLDDCPPITESPPDAGSSVFLVGYRADEINIAAGRAIGQVRRYSRTLLANCEKAGLCEIGGLIPGGHSGSPVIDAREQLIGITKGDEASTGTTFIEPILGLRQAIGSFCKTIRTKRSPGLELVDLSFAKTASETSFPMLDVKVRNTGNVAYIKRAIFNVQHVWQVKTGWQPGNICSSWNYDVILPILGSPNPVVIRMSQEVKTGATDRFTFTLGNDAPPGLEQYAFLVDATLVYDQDDKRLVLPKLFFVADSAKSNVARNTGGQFRDAFLHNLQIVDELGPFSGLMNEEAQLLVRRHSERIVPTYLDLLSSAIPERRKAASSALTLLGYRAVGALAALERVAKDDIDEEVRKAANAAMEAIRTSVKVDISLGAKAPLVIDRDQILTAKDSCLKVDLVPETKASPSEKDMGREAESAEESSRKAGYEADSLLRNRQFDESIAKATQAILGGINSARFTRGRAYLSTSRFEEAVSDFTHLIESGGDYYDWNRGNRALAYARLGRVAEARVDFDKAVAMSAGNNAGILALRGSFFLSLGEKLAAISDYRAAIAREPDEVGYYADLTEALIIDDQHSAALNIVTQVRELAAEKKSRRTFLTIAEFLESVATLCQGGQRRDATSRLARQLAENSKPSWNFQEMERWMKQTKCSAGAMPMIRELISLLQ